ncbi:MAG: proton-conducting transporter membrane subunit [Acidobacteria bacterium]|nr:proton-conducting transporter membrane subunit [Acidobacteriota bacterium]
MIAAFLLPLFWLMVVGYGITASGLIMPTPRLIRAVTAIGSVVGGAAGLTLACLVLWTDASLTLEAPALLTVAGGWLFHLDRLGALFLALISGVAIPVGIYATSYTASYEGRYSTRWMAFNFGVFLLSMSLVTAAANAITFLLCWELMAISSFFLVVTEHDREESVRAGVWYLAMTHAGLLALLSAFFLLGADGPTAAGWTFAAMRSAAPQLPSSTRNAIFLLALLGFGSKAGMVPFHVWLPRAHPAAPSHVSALMSAVMVKLGIYGLLRIGLDVLGGGPSWWGTLIIILGAASALTGVLYALVADDLKRLLAYSTVENVGLVLLGVGAGFLFLSLSQPEAAMLAMAAALLHVINHAAFKGTLFLSAGSIVHATGTRDMNLLGGLVKRAPWTVATFLVGAMSIAALPPLNGFVSEWLLFQSFLPGVASSRAAIAGLLTLGVGALALTGGLAAATFVKAFGISCLAIPRSNEAAQAHESPRSMRVGMVLMAASCPLLALATIPTLTTITGALATLAGLGGLSGTTPVFHLGVTLRTPNGMATMSPVAIALVLVAALVGTWIVVRVVARRTVRIGDTWGCGRIGQTPRMEYTSTAFAEPLRRVFDQLYRPNEDMAVGVVHPESPYYIQSVTYRTTIHPWFQRVLYDPLVDGVERVAVWTRRLQSGSVNAYLGYIVFVLVLLLVWVIGF